MLDLVEVVPKNPLRDVPCEEVINWIEINKSVPVVEKLSEKQIIQNAANQEDAQVQGSGDGI